MNIFRKDGAPITVKALGNKFTYLGKPAIFGNLSVRLKGLLDPDMEFMPKPL